MNNVSWSAEICIQPISKREASHKFRQTMWVVQPSNENQGPLSQPWLVCEHMRLRACDQYTSSTHWWKRWSRSKFASHYTWGTNGVCECKMDVKFTWIPTWHWMGSCFMVTWTTFKNPPLEVGLTQTQRPWHSERSQPLVHSILSCVRTRRNRNSLK